MSKTSNYIGISLWLFVLIAMLAWIAKTIQVQSDLSLFIPEQESIIHSLLIHQLNQGNAGRTIFISIEGGAINHRSQISRQLTKKLQSSPLFELVFNGEQQFSDDEINWFLKYRYLLSPNITAGHFSESQLKIALQQRLDELALPVPTIDKKYLPRDPTVELREILNRIDNKKPLHKYEGVWTSEDETQAIIITQTSSNAVNLNKQQLVVDFIESNFQKLNTDTSLQLQLTGLPVASILSRKLIQSESRRFSLVATISLLCILYIGFRSTKLVFLSGVPILSAVITGLFTVLVWFNSIHGITLVFAITILGIAIDYPLHLFSHLTPHQPSVASIKKIWSTMRMGLLTTVIAFLTLVFSNFEGLFQLGLFTAAGLLMAALTTRFILPSLIGKTRTEFQLTTKSILLSNRQGQVLITACLLFIIVTFAQDSPKWEKNLSSLSPLPNSYVQRDKQLRSMIGAGDLRFIGMIQGNSMEQILQESEKLRPVFERLVQRNIIQHYDMAANYIPSQALQDNRRAFLLSEKQLAQNLNSAQKDLPFKSGLFQPFIQDIENSRKLDNIIIADLKGMPYESAVHSLIMKQSQNYFAIISFSGLTDHQALVETFNNKESSDASSLVTIHDLQAISSSLLIDFYSDFLKRVIAAVLIIGLILLISLQDFQRTLLVISVLFLSLMLEISILTALDHHFTLFHLVSLILVFGLGLDYALFFTRREPVLDKQKTFYGLLICVISSALVFGILGLSKIPVLHIIGMTTAIGVLLSFFFSMLMTSLFVKDEQGV